MPRRKATPEPCECEQCRANREALLGPLAEPPASYTPPGRPKGPPPQLTRLDLADDYGWARHQMAVAHGLLPYKTEPDPRYADVPGANHRFVYYVSTALARVPDVEMRGGPEVASDPDSGSLWDEPPSKEDLQAMRDEMARSPSTEKAWVGPAGFPDLRSWG